MLSKSKVARMMLVVTTFLVSACSSPTAQEKMRRLREDGYVQISLSDISQMVSYKRPGGSVQAAKKGQSTSAPTRTSRPSVKVAAVSPPPVADLKRDTSPPPAVQRSKVSQDDEQEQVVINLLD